MAKEIKQGIAALYTLADVERITRRCVTTLRTDVRQGRLPIVRLGRQIRVTGKALRAFIAGKQAAK